MTNVSLVFPGDTSYSELNKPVCLAATSYPPNVLVLPQSTNEVAAVVKCAAADALIVVGGGHNYASYSFGGEVTMLMHNMTSI